MAPLVARITLTLPVINATRHAVFLVTGEDKAEAMARAFGGPPTERPGVAGGRRGHGPLRRRGGVAAALRAPGGVAATRRLK